MAHIHDIHNENFQSGMLEYLDHLGAQSRKVSDMIDELPISLALRSEMKQTWRITRQKLLFFRKELERCDGELREELEVLHGALLPEVISYQIRLGAMIIHDSCTDHRYLHRWKAMWRSFNAI